MMSATAETDLKRIAIAGGAISMVIARTLGIEVASKISPGPPLCRAVAHRSPVDGLEVIF